ncbi:MAG TPA: discoidin domain-containing protein [Puia sp.]|nr:discoidin domain-containing protein [Puia sp.]
MYKYPPIYFLAFLFSIPGFSQGDLDKGMLWPEGRVVPQFATPADPVDLLDMGELQLGAPERLLFTVLQGLVNKTKPRIMLLDKGGEGKGFWIRNCDLKVNKITSPRSLLDKYRNEISGVVLYKASQNFHFINLATTICGIRNAVPVEDSLYQNLQKQGVALPPVVTDLRNLAFSTPLEVYEYMYSNYWKDCNKRLYISLSPNCSNFIRDLAVATRSAVIWLDVRKKEDSTLADKFLKDMPGGRSFIMGWWPEERSGVGLGTKYGIATIAADFFENATLFAGQSQNMRLPAVPAMPRLENKIYVTFFLSDGDNIQYCQHALAKLWNDTSRGIIPINWTISPALVDVCPQILNYYYRTATENDCFASGPSGVGYALIYDVFKKRFNLQNDSILRSYTRFSQPVLERSGLRMITIWDDVKEGQMDIYAKNCRYLYGCTREDWERGLPLKTFIKEDRMPFIPNLPGYTSSIDQIYKKWRDTIRGFDGAKPIFLTAQGVSWRMTAENLVALKERLDSLSPGNIVVCRGDHFFNLFDEANHHYFNLCLLPDGRVTSSDEGANYAAVADGSPSMGHQWVASRKGRQWVKFDLKKEFLINRYVIRHAGAAGMAASFNTRSFRVETSNDDRKWKTASICSNNKDDVSDSDIQPVKARYVRVRIIDPGGDDLARIGEVEIYGKN